jgi:elongation factor P
MQYLYKEGEQYCFMDIENYEQVFLTDEQVGDVKNFLIENMEVAILFFEDRPIGVTPPNSVDLLVVQSEPWAKGDSVSGNYKPVILETGYKILVPPFVNEGEKIKVDTRSGEYLTRVKD